VQCGGGGEEIYQQRGPLQASGTARIHLAVALDRCSPDWPASEVDIVSLLPHGVIRLKKEPDLPKGRRLRGVPEVRNLGATDCLRTLRYDRGRCR
jgi:hypothetical protein